jgi:hypothetical protein
MRQLADLNSASWQFREEGHDRHLLRCLLEMMAIEFEPASMQTFRHVALEGATGVEAAGELGLPVAAVSTDRSRVLHRLREGAEGPIEELVYSDREGGPPSSSQLSGRLSARPQPRRHVHQRRVGRHE